ncbi:MAG TPA: FxLYD domain-containing protein [Rhodocyclaceae bacterium]|nr:FxLYD domain-containing protein [Rhodocyclaceae bacterium]
MIERLKKVLETVAQGAMFGLGFGIAAWVLYFAFQTRMQEPHAYRSPVESTMSAKENAFVFRDVREVTRNGRTYFIGSVKNNGSMPARGINIEVNLFAKDKFVDQYSSYVTGDIGPGEERYFKVACGCKDETPAQHDSYKIAVVGGY